MLNVPCGIGSRIGMRAGNQRDQLRVGIQTEKERGQIKGVRRTSLRWECGNEIGNEKYMGKRVVLKCVDKQTSEWWE